MGQGAATFQAAEGLFDCAKGGLQQSQGFTPSKRQRKELDLDSSAADYLTQKKAEAARVRAEASARLIYCAEERAMWSRSGVFQVHWSGDEPSDWADLDDDNQDVSRSPDTSPSLLDRRRLQSMEGDVVQKLPPTLLESGLSAEPMSPGPRACSGELESPTKGEKPRLPAEESFSPKDLQQHCAIGFCSSPESQGGNSRSPSRLQPL